MSLKGRIAEILQIQDNDSWTIKDSDPENDLYLVHYEDHANMNQYGHLRGVVVDMDAQVPVCTSYGYTPSATYDQIEKWGDGNYHLLDLFGEEHILDPQTISIKYGFEGTIMRVFKNKGKVYHSTHKRLFTENSSWGLESTPFKQMYEELGGPSDDELFNSQSDYSPYCHIFIMVHPDVLIASKEPVQTGYLVYLGAKQMWSVELEKSPFKQRDEDGNPLNEDWANDPRPDGGYIDDTLYFPKYVNKLDAYREEPVIYYPPEISETRANHYLRYGIYDTFKDEYLDRRLRTGEFVILYQHDENGEIKKVIKVQSKAYEWRTFMRGNDPNLLRRFYELTNGAQNSTNTAEGRQLYQDKFPILTFYDKEEVKQQINDNEYIVVWPQNDQYTSFPEDYKSRLYNIWLAYLMAVPPLRQKEVSEYLDHFIKHRTRVVYWLQQLEILSNVEDLNVYSRAKQIIFQSRKYASQETEAGRNKDKSGRELSMKELKDKSIHTLVMREKGESLYKLVNSMKKNNTSK